MTLGNTLSSLAVEFGSGGTSAGSSHSPDGSHMNSYGAAEWAGIVVKLAMDQVDAVGGASSIIFMV